MLNAAAITEFTTESGPVTLLAEWLRLYFDGADHVVGTNAPVTFPKAFIAFGQAPIEQLSARETGSVLGDQDIHAEIRVVIFPRGGQIAWVSATGADAELKKLATDPVLLTFQVRAKQQGPGQSEYLARNVAELLHALLTNPTTRYDLAQKGLSHIFVQPINPLPTAEFAMRILSCSCVLRYEVKP